MNAALRAGLVLGGLGLAFFLRGPLGKAHERRREVELPYVPPPTFARIASAGHTSTMADLLWLKALPDLSRRFASLEESQMVALRRKRLWLDDVVAAISELEPTFSTVYGYASAYFDLVARDPDKAIELLELGVRNNPGDLLLKINLGMAILIHREDRPAALRIFQEVVDHPDCDAWSLALCAKLLVDERQDFAALAHYSGYARSSDDATREAASLYLERTRKNIFMRAYREYEAAHGDPPSSVEQLRDPALMAPEVMDEVLSCAVVQAGRKPDFPRLWELEFSRFLDAARDWSRAYHASAGEWPDYQQLIESGQVTLPQRLPVGKTVVLDEGEVRIVDAPR